MPLNTIPTGGIVDGQIIFATHSLAIIRALNGETAAYTIVASGSTYLLNAFITGSLFGTASWALHCLTASFADYATSASWANTASYTISASYASQSQFAVTASNARTASYYNEVDPIFVNKSSSLATTGSNQFSGSQGITGSVSISGSLTVRFLPTGSQYIVTYDSASGQLFYTSSTSVGGATPPGGTNLQIQYNSQSNFAGATALRYNPATGLTTIDSIQATGSYSGSLTGSLLGTSSWAISASVANTALTSSYVVTSQTASYYNEIDPIFNAKSSSLATTGSNQFNDNQNISGSVFISSSITVKGLLNQTRPNVIFYDSASGQFYYASSASSGGTGSLTPPGGTNTQLQYNNNGTFGGATALRYNSSSGLTTIDLIQSTGSISGSITGSLLGTSSWALNALLSNTASYALLSNTASFYNEIDPVFNAKSSSFATTASNNFGGNQVITGSLIVSGSSTIIFRNLVSQSRQYIVVYDTASGQLSYVLSSSIASSGSGVPAGSDTMIQYNNSGTFGGATALRYNQGTGLTTVDFIQATGSMSGSFTGSFKGNLVGTASWSSNSLFALTSSLAFLAQTASYYSQSVEVDFIPFGKGGGQLTSSAELTWNSLFPHFIGINSISSSGVLISRNTGKSAGIILATNTGSLTASFRWAHFIDNDDNYAFRRYDDTGSFIDNTIFLERLTNRVNFPVLAGTGVRMVVADATGSISTQAVPTGSAAVNTGSFMTTGSVSGNVLTFTKGDGSTFPLTVSTGSGGSSTTKAGTASIASFGGTPLTASVTFGTAFSNTNYSISVLGQKSDSRSWTIESQATSNFVINSNSNSSLTNPVFWIATPFNNS